MPTTDSSADSVTSACRWRMTREIGVTPLAKRQASHTMSGMQRPAATVSTGSTQSMSPVAATIVIALWIVCTDPQPTK
jgi:hypothetical protein